MRSRKGGRGESSVCSWGIGDGGPCRGWRRLREFSRCSGPQADSRLTDLDMVFSGFLSVQPRRQHSVRHDWWHCRGQAHRLINRRGSRTVSPAFAWGGDGSRPQPAGLPEAVRGDARPRSSCCSGRHHRCSASRVRDRKWAPSGRGSLGHSHRQWWHPSVCRSPCSQRACRVQRADGTTDHHAGTLRVTRHAIGAPGRLGGLLSRGGAGTTTQQARQWMSLTSTSQTWAL